MNPLRSVLVVSTLAITFLLPSAAQTRGADLPSTILSQGPAGYRRLNETNQPPPPSPAANFGTLGAGLDGQYLDGVRLGQPGALTNSTDTSAQFFNPTQDVTLGGSKGGGALR